MQNSSKQANGIMLTMFCMGNEKERVWNPSDMYDKWQNWGYLIVKKKKLITFSHHNCRTNHAILDAVATSKIWKTLPLENAFQGRNHHPNPMLASPSLSWDAFIWSIFEGSIDASFATLDMSQICAFNFMKLKNKNGVLKLQLVVNLCMQM